MASPSRPKPPSVDDTRARAAFAALLSRTKPAVEDAMTALFTSRVRERTPNGPEVRDVMHVAQDLSMRGGKRFRAALLASSYLGAAAKGRMDVAVAGGVSLEMLQSYLLIQDDWMDGDVERRGGPSAHVALAHKLGRGPLKPEHAGAVGALLGSDFVWGLAVEALLGAKAPAEVVVRAVKQLIQIHEDVVAGQVLDTVAKKRDVEKLHDLKTGSYTVRGPLLLGAVLAGGKPAAMKALRAYADPLGVAFQLRDDLLGVFGTEAEAGRPQGSDLMSAKDTSVMRFAMPKLKGNAKKSVLAVWNVRRPSKKSVLAAVAAIEETGARTAVEKRLAALCTDAEKKAAKLPLSARARDELRGASLAIRVGPGGREAR